MRKNRPLVLVILDGWGYRDQVEGNAIASATKPTWDKIWQQYPHALISGSGKCVGLPHGQMGNSEVGHLTMGAGRTIYQDLTRIDMEIEEGEFFKNKTLIAALSKAKANNKAVHILGLLSPGGVHSHEEHLFALIKLTANLNVNSVYLHPFLDGRDTPPQSAKQSLKKLMGMCDQHKNTQIVSLIGRYYAMDRDKRWERVQKAYELIVQANAPFHAHDAISALEMAYQRGETDEFVQATSIHTGTRPPPTVNDGDVVIFMNFRADRARELTRSFIDPNFHEFPRKRFLKLGEFVCLSEYDAKFELPLVFPPLSLTAMFAELISKAGLKQLRIAETEKYAHVTFFFNGGIETPYPGEERILIPSAKVATYDLKPTMSANEVTEALIRQIEQQKFDVIICNFANPDMVGHTGNFAATVTAIETIDTCLAKIITALQLVGGELIITADHGNAEQMFDEQTNQPHTAHTSDPIPFIFIGREAQISQNDGKLSDIAPTMLYLLGLPQPTEMTGKSLIKFI